MPFAQNRMRPLFSPSTAAFWLVQDGIVSHSGSCIEGMVSTSLGVDEIQLPSGSERVTMNIPVRAIRFLR
jgi:hypothetical protein